MAYTKVGIPDCQDHYYVVTMLQKAPSHQPHRVSGNISTTTSLSALNHENLYKDSVDISGVANMINQEYGMNYWDLNWQVPWHHKYQLILLLRKVLLLGVSCFLMRILH